MTAANILSFLPPAKTLSSQMAQPPPQVLDLIQRFDRGGVSAGKTPQEKTALERQITATDSQIDRLVYDLYGLTEAEITIVGRATA